MKQSDVDRALEQQLEDFEQVKLEKPQGATKQQWARAIKKWNKPMVN